jgi:hypothetical protein
MTTFQRRYLETLLPCPDHLILQLQWPVLRTNRRCGYGLKLSPVIANFYMEDFEERALDLAPHKPICWFRFVDDTFVISPHGPNNLKDILNHLNSIHECIQFIMGTESEGHLPLLYIDIYRRPDGSLGHRMYRKATHTNLYLNAGSHHHPSSKQAVLSKLVLYAIKRACMLSWCS